jgi:hypothetical protein
VLQVPEQDIGCLLLHHNTSRQVLFQDSPESINHLLPPPSPEFPFGQESSSPPLSLMCGEEPSLNPLSPMPHLEQDDLDAWLNNRSEVDEGTAEHT